jgi:hypothetical protein
MQAHQQYIYTEKDLQKMRKQQPLTIKVSNLINIHYLVFAQRTQGLLNACDPCSSILLKSLASPTVKFTRQHQITQKYRFILSKDNQIELREFS